MFVNNELLAKWHASMKHILAIFLVLSVCGSSFALTQDDGSNSVNKLTESLTPEKVCTSNGAGNPKLFLGKIDRVAPIANRHSVIDKMTSNTVLASNFNTQKLSFSQVRNLDSGGKQAYMNYDGGMFVIQTPSMTLPYGMSAFDKAGPIKYSAEFSLRGFDEAKKNIAVVCVIVNFIQLRG